MFDFSLEFCLMTLKKNQKRFTKFMETSQRKKKNVLGFDFDEVQTHTLKYYYWIRTFPLN